MTELAFDVGQSQTRVRLIADDGSRRELELDGHRYGAEITSTIVDRCTEAAGRFGVAAVRSVAGGLTGLHGGVPALEDVRRRLAETLGVERVVIADDAATSHLGALDGDPGALVAAGTGIVGLGIGPAGVARVDGAGFLIGDDGSGWWIGRRGIIAALSYHDGRAGGSASLLSAVERQYGPVADVPSLIAASSFPVGLVASFAPAVAAVARENDPVAVAIWTDAAHHIADAVVAAAIRAGFAAAAEFAWAVTGRLTGAGDLIDPVLNSTVREHFPVAVRRPPAGSALDGAERLLHHPDVAMLAPLVGVSAKE